MNKKRRQEIAVIIAQIETMKETGDTDDICGIIADLNGVLNDEEIAFDNLSVGLQSTMRGQNMEDAIDAMNSALSALEDKDFEAAIQALEEIY